MQRLCFGANIMSTPTIPPALLDISYLLESLRSRENQLGADLVIKLHSDGSGRVQDNSVERDIYVFENTQQLARWLFTPLPHEEPFTSDACVAKNHCICANPRCHCRCHQAEEGIGA